MERAPERILDEYLVSLSRGGSREAFDRLARRWTPQLLRYAARTLGWSACSADSVREVVQETWLGVIRGLHGLEDPARFHAWIYGIAARKCADAIRGNMRRRRLDAGLRAEASTPGPEADDRAAPERYLDLASGVAALPDDQRSIVHLFYGADLAIEEIASALGIPGGTVKSRLHHAREALRRHIELVSTVSPPSRTQHERHR